MARSKRKPGEKDRTLLWYKLTLKSMIKIGTVSSTETGGRKLGEVLASKAAELDLPWKGCREHLGSPEAWRWYQCGRSTPGPKTRRALDILLSKLRQQKIGWVVSGSGEVELAPAWVWPISETKFLSKSDIKFCAEFESNFWHKIDFSGESVPCLSHYYGGIKNYPGPDCKTNWPPRIVLPLDIAKSLPFETGSPFPHLFTKLPKFIENSESQDQEPELLSSFIAWSKSYLCMYADGEEWYQRLQTLPGSPFYLGSVIAYVGVKILEDNVLALSEKKLQEEIRYHLPSQNSHISSDGK
ncbi:MAG: hypothetical protein RBR06_01845 [Desulfuromonadaceae bacterium]|nr:hypothetical protein [Desulfuromonadaceae bacterium]